MPVQNNAWLEYNFSINGAWIISNFKNDEIYQEYIDQCSVFYF